MCVSVICVDINSIAIGQSLLTKIQIQKALLYLAARVAVCPSGLSIGSLSMLFSEGKSTNILFLY